MTPEGKIKEKVREALRQYGAYYLQPVQFGMGGAGLDFHCGMRVRQLHVGFYVETKDRDKPLTPRQQLLVDNLREMKARVFIVNDEVTLGELRRYLARLHMLDQEYRDEHHAAL